MRIDSSRDPGGLMQAGENRLGIPFYTFNMDAIQNTHAITKTIAVTPAMAPAKNIPPIKLQLLKNIVSKMIKGKYSFFMAD